MTNLITEHIDVWTAAQAPRVNVGRGPGNNSNSQTLHGIKKLRELILELAVRGSLVPQDPKDEPASVLLEKIAKEKARLVKEGTIKKQKPLSKSNDDEKVSKVPKGWSPCRLGDFINLVSGQHLKPHEYTDVSEKGMIPYLTGPAEFGIEFPNPTRFTNEKRALALKGDILLTCKGSGVGKVNLSNSEIAISRQLMSIQPVLAYNRYVCFLMMSLNYILREKIVGIAIPGISREDVLGAIVKLPPLPEQHRIVAKIDELMVLCDQLEQQQTDSNENHKVLVETLLSTLTQATDQTDFTDAWQRIADHFDNLFTTEASIDQLKQTILQLAVMGKLVPQDLDDEPASSLIEKIAKEKAKLIKQGKIRKQKPLPEIGEDEKPSWLPKSWALAYVGECFALKSGTTFKKEQELDNGQYIYLKVADMNLEGNELKINTSSRFINPTPKELNALIPAGSIIFPKRGGAIATNKKRFVKKDLFVDLNIMAISPLKGINLDYAYLWLLTKDLAQLNSGTSVPQINNKDISPLVFPIPPINEQDRIVAKIDELMALCEDLKNQLIETQTIQAELADAIVEQAVA